MRPSRRVPLALAHVPLPRVRFPVRKVAVQPDMNRTFPTSAFLGAALSSTVDDRKKSEDAYAGCIGYEEHQRRHDQLGKQKALEDVLPCEPGLVPAAGAVIYGKKHGRDRPPLFKDYEETTEEASELLPEGGRRL